MPADVSSPGEPEAAPASAAPRARHWDADRVLSISAIVIGLCSLFITLYQTHLTRQAQSAQVLPYLVFGLISNDAGTHITLRNDGVGPARIENLRIHFRGTARATDPYEFFIAERPTFTAGRIGVDKVAPGRFIPAGATILMIGAEGSQERLAMLAELLRLFALADAPRAWLAEAKALEGDKAVIEVIYSSVYGDRWRLRSDQLVPQAQ